jgi:aminoglycoside N3'-acetyltransferase
VKVVPREILDELGIERGGMLFIKASMDRLEYDGRQTVALLEALIDRVGPDGTLVMPSFAFPNWIGRPAAGFVFDVRRTSSQMGLLSEVLRRYPGTRRSAQYWVPACAWGKHAATLTDDQLEIENPFGAGSTYRRLVERGATMIGLGVSLNYNIVAHVADAVLAPRYTFAIFSEAPLFGTVVTADGRRYTTRTIIVRQEHRTRVKPSRLMEASPRLAAATRFFTHEAAFVWSQPAALWFEEALAIGEQRLNDGRLPPWLDEIVP